LPFDTVKKMVSENAFESTIIVNERVLIPENFSVRADKMPGLNFDRLRRVKMQSLRACL
jgi:hypothetical protein